jgi:hypothetical protein
MSGVATTLQNLVFVSKDGDWVPSGQAVFSSYQGQDYCHCDVKEHGARLAGCATAIRLCFGVYGCSNAKTSTELNAAPRSSACGEVYPFFSTSLFPGA